MPKFFIIGGKATMKFKAILPMFLIFVAIIGAAFFASCKTDEEGRNNEINLSLEEAKKIYDFEMSADNNVTISKYTGSENEVIIPDKIDGNKVTSIGEKAFDNYDSLKSVKIPDSVVSIGYWAFYRCSGLESVTIPDSVTEIGDMAFYACESLANITIPTSVTEIKDWAFGSCNGLTSIAIPDSVVSIGNSAFYCCSSLESVMIPDSVVSIGEMAFYGCVALANITIPDSVTDIGNMAFYDCETLTIKCFEGSAAHKYCTENDIDFTLI